LHKKSVVAAWLRAASNDQPITIDGDGEQTRDFVFVDDLAAAMAAALEAPRNAVAGEVFQVGTGRETMVNALAAAVERAVGRRLDIRHVEARVGDVRRNVSRVDKAARVLGYRAEVSLDDGLRMTAQWFEAALRDPSLASIAPHAGSGSD
jgi:UDP-glucose 4-epimerase